MQLSETSHLESMVNFGNIAIIGGTGFERLPPDMFGEDIVVETNFGDVHLMSVSNNYVEPYKLYFLSRHGSTHGLAPHQINYRANIAALQQLEVRFILATNAVGALRTAMQPGELVLMDDFIDYTRNRQVTMMGVEPGGEKWNHTDFSNPYSENLRTAIRNAAENVGLSLHTRCTYLCVDGPRFESPAEVRMFAAWGADVVGMTGLPEAIFAREAKIDYAAVGIITNLAAGLCSQPVSHEGVVDAMALQIPIVRELLLEACAVIRRQQGF